MRDGSLRRSALLTEGGIFLLLALALLMVAYVWVDRANPTGAPYEISYSVLFGLRVPQEDLSARATLAAGLRPVLLWGLAVAGVLVPTEGTRRMVVLGALTLFGIGEFLFFLAVLIGGVFISFATFLGMAASAFIASRCMVLIFRAKNPTSI